MAQNFGAGGLTTATCAGQYSRNLRFVTTQNSMKHFSRLLNAPNKKEKQYATSLS
jgi:hypothetical protein